MRDAFFLILDMAGLFGCYGLISFFYTRREFWGFQALLVLFWTMLFGFVWLLAGDIFRISDMTELRAIWSQPLQPAVHRSILVAGLWAGNFWLRRRWKYIFPDG